MLHTAVRPFVGYTKGLRSVEGGKGGVRSLPNSSRCCLHILKKVGALSFPITIL